MRTTYSYNVALKGKGTFILRAWIQGIDPMTGNTTRLGFPDLIKVRLTDTWVVATGTLKTLILKIRIISPESILAVRSWLNREAWFILMN